MKQISTAKQWTLWRVALVLIHFSSTEFCSGFSNIPCNLFTRPCTLVSTSIFTKSLEDATIPDTARENLENKRVVIVGGGVGGLAVAARLASSIQETKVNWEVTVLEKNSKEMVGGRCGSFDVDVPEFGVFRHERGPSLLLLKGEYEQLFESCMSKGTTSLPPSSTPISEQFGLKIEQCVPAYQVVFEDGDAVDLGFPKATLENESADTLKQLEQRSRDKMNELEVDGAKKWDEYMSATSAFLNCGLPNFIEEKLDLLSFPTFLFESLRDWGKIWPLKPHSDVLDAIFSSEKMRALASFQDLYVGLEPYRNDKGFGGGVLKKTAPAVFGLLAALEVHPTNNKSGVFAPIGGFRAVGEAFQELAEKCGAKVKFELTVTQIDKKGVHYIESKEGGKKSQFLKADLIIVNADLPYAEKSLLSSKNQQPASTKKNAVDDTFDWDDSFDFSSGVVAFHWCINKRLEKLNTHNVFLVGLNRSDAELSWRAVRDNPSTISVLKSKSGRPPTAEKKEEIILEPFNFYVHRAAKTDPSAAPDGCDSIMVLVPCSPLIHDEKYSNLPREEAIQYYKTQFNDSYIKQIRNAVVKRLQVLDGLEEVEKHIVHETVDTPGTYADLYNVGAGVPFGLSHGFNQLSVTRPAAECKEMDNVLYVGASSRPGNGVPLVLIGAKAVTEKAMKRIKSSNLSNIE